MDWENAAANHPEWSERHNICHSMRSDPTQKLRCWWSNTTLFQQLQRFAHGDTELDNYLTFVRRKIAQQSAVRFVFMPVTRRSSTSVRAVFAPRDTLGASGRARIDAAFAALADEGVTLSAPSKVLTLLTAPGAGCALTLEAPPAPYQSRSSVNIIWPVGL